MTKKKWKPVVFRDGANRIVDADRFTAKCLDPKYVANGLAQYQLWRRGEGEYEWDGDPEKRPEEPFCPKAFSILVDAAIGRLLEYNKILVERMRKRNA